MTSNVSLIRMVVIREQRMASMVQVDPAEVVLGLRPEALSESVSLATPLTLGRISGRDEVVPILEELTAAFGVHDT